MKLHYLPVAGAVALLVGSFLPVYSLPLLGSVTWIGNGATFGTVTVLLAVVTAALSASQKHRLVWVTGWLHLVLLVLGLAGFYCKKGQLGAAALHRSSTDLLNLWDRALVPLILFGAAFGVYVILRGVSMDRSNGEWKGEVLKGIAIFFAVPVINVIFNIVYGHTFQINWN